MGADEIPSTTPEGATGSEITTGTVLAALEAQNNKFEDRLLVEAPMEDDSRTLMFAKAIVSYGNGAQGATYTVFGINSEKGLVRMDFDARTITDPTDPVIVGRSEADYPVKAREGKKISPDQLTQLTKEEEINEWSEAFKHQRDYLYAKLRTEAETRRIQSGFLKQALDTINDGISV